MRFTTKLEMGARRVLCWLLLLTPMRLRAQTGPAPSATVQAGRLSFSAHATVGDFVGSTTTVSGAITGDLLAARGWVESPVATLVTDNEHRDRDLRASMEVDKYPTMRFDLAGISTAIAGTASTDSASVMLHGTLSIHGVKRIVDLPATAVRGEDTIRVTSTFPLDLDDYHIGGLTKMLGLLRMDSKIMVQVDLRFRSKSSLKAEASIQ